MSNNSTKKPVTEQYNRLKNVLKKLLNPERREPLPQLALQPVRDKKYF